MSSILDWLERQKILIIFLFIILLLLRYFLYLYPVIQDFSFSNMLHVKSINYYGNIRMFTSNPANAIYILISSQILGLPIYKIIMLPMLLVPIVFLFMAVLRILNSKLNISIYILLLTSFLFPISTPVLFTCGCHEMGILLFFSLLILIKLKFANISNLPMMSLSIIIILISLNFISYKIIVLAIIFLFFLEFIDIVECHQNAYLGKSYGLRNILMIGIILLFAFNEFFYKVSMPFFKLSMGEQDLGISKLMQKFFLDVVPESSIDNVLVPFLYSTPKSLFYNGIIRFFLILIPIVVIYYILYKKYADKSILTPEERIYAAMVLSGLSIFCAYNIMGLFEIFYLMIFGVTGFILLYDLLPRSFKLYISFLLIILVLVSLIYMIQVDRGDYNSGHRDYNEFNYMSYPANWFMKNINTNKNIKISSDIFTRGYILDYIYENTNDKYLNPFNEEISIIGKEDLMLFLKSKNNLEMLDPNKYYIVNYKLKYFVTSRWYNFKSLLNFKESINSNMKLNKLYSNDCVDIISGLQNS